MRRIACLGIAALALLGSGCPDDAGGSCLGAETVTVKMTGTCSPGERTFDIVRSGCGIFLTQTQTDAGMSDPVTTLGLPLQGALGQHRAPLRQGGWSLWGCLNSTEPCPGQFRLCSTERVAFQLNVSCLDSTGAPACEAVLTE